MQRNIRSDATLASLNTVRRLRIMLMAAFLLLASSVALEPPLHGQAQNSGGVSGRVVDSTGAAIPGATVQLKSTDAGREMTSVSNQSGEYIFNDVPIGNYNLTVIRDGFETYTVNGLEVDAASQSAVNATLTVGKVDVSVSVAAPSSTVDPTSSTIAAVIDPNLIANLPLEGNNVVEAAALLPGVTNVNAPSTGTSDTGGPTYNVNGGRNNQNLLLLDGTLWNNLYNNTGINFPPRQGLAEVSVILNGYKAQYGRSVGSVFNVLTKAGSNSIGFYIHL